MNDLASLTGAPKVLRVGGRDYAFHPFAFEDFGYLQEWIDRQFDDPVDLATVAIDRGRLVVRDGKRVREPFPVAQQQAMLRTAQELQTRGRHLLGTPEADEKAQSLEGVKEVVYLSVRKGDPAFTREDADRLYKLMGPGDIARVFQATDVDMAVSGDPKGPPAGTGPTPTEATPGGTATA
jgi:hypothetical protein